MKITLELDKNLSENELLIYKNGKVHSVEIHELLPELKRLKEIDGLRDDLDYALKAIRELRGED